MIDNFGLGLPHELPQADPLLSHPKEKLGTKLIEADPLSGIDEIVKTEVQIYDSVHGRFESIPDTCTSDVLKRLKDFTLGPSKDINRNVEPDCLDDSPEAQACDEHVQQESLLSAQEPIINIHNIPVRVQKWFPYSRQSAISSRAHPQLVDRGMLATSGECLGSLCNGMNQECQKWRSILEGTRTSKFRDSCSTSAQLMRMHNKRCVEDDNDSTSSSSRSNSGSV
uniref:Uncharacterized protein n=1 Tax=Timema tahoe TaxID=61484 RepID=A0A7R9NXZ5_9NEOP|nr:unnamed protein product [Timema tahoe]